MDGICTGLGKATDRPTAGEGRPLTGYRLEQNGTREERQQELPILGEKKSLIRSHGDDASKVMLEATELGSEGDLNGTNPHVTVAEKDAWNQGTEQGDPTLDIRAKMLKIQADSDHGRPEGEVGPKRDWKGHKKKEPQRQGPPTGRPPDDHIEVLDAEGMLTTFHRHPGSGSLRRGLRKGFTVTWREPLVDIYEFDPSEGGSHETDEDPEWPLTYLGDNIPRRREWHPVRGWKHLASKIESDPEETRPTGITALEGKGVKYSLNTDEVEILSDLPELESDSEEDTDCEEEETMSVREQVMYTVGTGEEDERRDGVETRGRPAGVTDSRDLCLRPMVCRTIVTIGPGPSTLEACIDSGATFSLLSVERWKQIKDLDGCGPLQKCDARLVGASGKPLAVEGIIRLTFSTTAEPGSDSYEYQHWILVGDLKGIDLLLGVDWLRSAGAQIDFGRMRVMVGPNAIIHLETDPFMRSRAKIYRVEGHMDPSETRRTYARVMKRQRLPAGHTTRVSVRVDGVWPAFTTGMFESFVTLGRGLEIIDCLVLPDEPTQTFWIGIANTTVEDVKIQEGIVLGDLQELQDLREEEDRNLTSLLRPIYGIWNIAAQTAGTIDAAGECGDGEVPEKVHHTFVLDQEGGLPEDVLHPFKSKRQVIVSEGFGHLIRTTGIRDVIRVCHVKEEQVGAAGGTLARGMLAYAEMQATLDTPLRRESPLFTTGNTPAGGNDPSPRKPCSVGYQDYEARMMRRLPAHMRCMLPPAGVLTEEEFASAVDLILEFEDVFVGPDGEVGYTNRIQHEIDTEDHEPIKLNPRKKSYMEKEHIAGEVAKLLASGQIRASKSPWGAPVVLVKKKDGTLRFCIDFRRLNDCTKKDAYPLPRIEECLECLGGNRFFHTMDLASGYWQVAVHPDDCEKTAFITPQGLFEWVVMPFGLCNAPATFCRLMELVLSDIVWRKCLVYLDDVISFGETCGEAMDNLRLVLLRLRMSNLKLKPKKCELFRTQVEYLGHQVTQEGIRPSEKKVEVLGKWKLPTSVTEVRTFLGFCSYYRRFVENFSALAQPLTALTKKGVVFPKKLDGECQEAFRSLIAILRQRVMLHYVEPKCKFVLDTDASQYAIGAALSQRVGDEERPLAFASKMLNTSRQRYCTTKRELYAVVYFLRYFQGYVRFSDVEIRTDHQCLKWLKNFRGPDQMYYRWITELDGWGTWTTITYRQGKANANADAMSRINLDPPRRRHESIYGPARRDCGYGNCIQCRQQFQAQRELIRLANSDSDEDQEDPGEGPYPGYELDGMEDEDTSEGDQPDPGDYALWELLVIRKEKGSSERRRGNGRSSQCEVVTESNRTLRSATTRRKMEEDQDGEDDRLPQRRKSLPRGVKGRPVTRYGNPRTGGRPRKKPIIEDPRKKRTIGRPPRTSSTSSEESSGYTSDPGVKRPRGRPRRNWSDEEDLSEGQGSPTHRSLRTKRRKAAYKRRKRTSRRTEERQARTRRSASESSADEGIDNSGEDCTAGEDSPGPVDEAPAGEPDSSPEKQRERAVEDKQKPSSGEGEHRQQQGPPEPEHWPLEMEIGMPKWSRMQMEDPVLGRVIQLMQDHGAVKPLKNELQGETIEVRALCKRWQLLELDESQVLHRRGHALEPGAGAVDVMQRLVPYALRKGIFRRIHGRECAHMGYERVHAMIWERFYWWNMAQDIHEWLRACRSCQQAKTGIGAGKMAMKLDLVAGPMMRVGMDLQGPFPTTKHGMVYILVIQDYFSKWVEMFPLPDKRAQTVAEILVKEFFTRYGVCIRLHSDQGKEFDAALTHQLCEMWGVVKTRTSPFAPWSNGMVERSNKTIKALLRQTCSKDYRSSWDQQLPFVRMTLNNTVHGTTGCTPFRLFMSQCDDAKLPCDLLFGRKSSPGVNCYIEYIEDQRRRCQEQVEMARQHIGKQMQIQRANKERGGLRVRTYKIGDYVWRLWKPFLTDKLHSTPWTGPYEVTDVDPSGYTVKLWVPRSGGGHCFKWIHTSNLKPVLMTKQGRMMPAIAPYGDLIQSSLANQGAEDRSGTRSSSTETSIEAHQRNTSRIINPEDPRTVYLGGTTPLEKATLRKEE